MRSSRARAFRRGGLVPDGSRIVDWPVSYEGELGLFYAQVEREIGVSGQAGNIGSERIPAGAFPGRPVLVPTPTDPTQRLESTLVDACNALGYHPFPRPQPQSFPGVRWASKGTSTAASAATMA